MNYIRGRLKPAGHKVGVSNPLISLVEGILSRGDGDCAAFIEKAWRAGCRLDAWQDEANQEVLRGILSEHRDLVTRILNGWKPDEVLPWDSIRGGTTETYFSREQSRSDERVFTSPCIENCAHPCGACGGGAGIVRNTAPAPVPDAAAPSKTVQNIIQPNVVSRGDDGTRRLLFSFEKKGRAVFHAHLSVLEVFSMAFVRADIPALYSEGFNPLPRLEVVAPLSLGIASDAEMAALDTERLVDCAAFIDRLNRHLPPGFAVTAAENYYIPRGQKKHSLSSLLWGFGYVAPDNSRVIIPKEKEKEFRASLGDPAGERAHAALYRLKRFAVLAGVPRQPGPRAPGVPRAEVVQGESYFSVFRRLYPA